MNGDFNKNLSWEEYRYHAVVEMERMSDAMEEMVLRLDKMEQRQVAFDTRTKITGSVYGFVAAALVEAGRAIASAFHR